MATEGILTSIPGLVASGDLSASQFFFVTLNGSAQVAVAGANVSVIGILQDKPTAAGQGCNVGYLGKSKLKLGGTVTVNDKVASDASGKGVKATAASVSAGTPEPLAGSYAAAIALESGVANDVISVLIVHAGITN
jgi:hypothetical protein